MKAVTPYVVGLRLQPEDPEPAWFTLWFEDVEGTDRVCTVDGRIQWVSRVGSAALLNDDEYSFNNLSSELSAVMDSAASMYILQHQNEDGTGTLRLFLGLLEDLLVSIGVSSAFAPLLDLYRQVLNGPSFHDAVATDEQRTLVLTAVATGLGYVLLFSDFPRLDA